MMREYIRSYLMYNIHIVRYCPQIHVKLEFSVTELLRSLHLVTLAQHMPESRNSQSDYTLQLSLLSTFPFTTIFFRESGGIQLKTIHIKVQINVFSFSSLNAFIFYSRKLFKNTVVNSFSMPVMFVEYNSRI